MRQISLDVETTGLDYRQGDRVIEIGCVEIQNRELSGEKFQTYLKVDKEISEEARNVHGISNEFLEKYPYFEEVVEDFLRFIDGAELLIHNASFDVPFLDQELQLLPREYPPMAKACARITDTLLMARSKNPGRNSLDALCVRYGVDHSARTLHGALRDADLLARVYLAMTGGQGKLELAAPAPQAQEARQHAAKRDLEGLKIRRADDAERSSHDAMLRWMEEEWRPSLWKEEPQDPPG